MPQADCPQLPGGPPHVQVPNPPPIVFSLTLLLRNAHCSYKRELRATILPPSIISPQAITPKMLARLQSRNLWPLIGAAGAIGAVGLAYRLSNPILNDTGKTFTGGDEWIDLKLKEARQVSHDSRHYVFELKDPEHTSGLITASCLMAKYVTEKGNNVIRPYTPISDSDQKGTIDFVIKTYENGKFSKHLWNLKPDDTVAFKGPVVKWKWDPNQFEKISLIGGGSGITPLYHLLSEIARNPEDKTKVDLYYASTSVPDILLKKEIDEIAAKHKDQVQIHYFVDKAEDGWEGNTGYIGKDFLKDHLPPPSKDSKIFVCGPPPMYKALSGMKVSPTDQGEVTGVLAELGYNKDHVFKF